MSDDPYDYEPQTQSRDDLDKLQKLCNAAILLRVQQEEQAKALALTESQIKLITEKHLPEVMESLRISHVGTESGVSVQLVEHIHASLPSEKKSPVRRRQVLDAIRRSGNEGLIKTVFKISYGRNAAKHVIQFRKVLDDNHVDMDASITFEESIHHATLRKFVRDMAKDPELDLSDFGGYRKIVAEIEV